jgi:hypothetical protein
MGRRMQVLVEYLYSILMKQQLKDKNSNLHNENHNLKFTRIWLHNVIYIVRSINEPTRQLSSLVIYYCNTENFM